MRRYFLLFITIFMTFSVYAEENKYPSNNSGLNIFGGKFEEIKSVKKLDKTIAELFTNIERHSGIADINEEFITSCIAQKDVPFRRLVRAGKIGDVTFIHYEKGGYGLGLHLLVVRMKNGTITSWQFLDPNKIWYSWEIEKSIPEIPICDEKNEYQYPEAYALGFCKR